MPPFLTASIERSLLPGVAKHIRVGGEAVSNVVNTV